MEEFARRLQAYYERSLPVRADVKVDELEMLPGGWESELYAFTLEHGAEAERASENLVLRLYSGSGAREKSAHEFGMLRRLDQVGYPVPRVELLETEDSPFGRPFVIMERIGGPTMWSLMLSGDEQEQTALLKTFCELFVRLHALEWRLFVDEAEIAHIEDPHLFVDRWFRHAYTELKRYSLDGFLPVMHWLHEHREALACRTPALVHGDFHPGNILFREDSAPIVIDWTGSKVSDARFDLAWTLLLAYAYLGSTWRERILKGYEGFARDEVAALEQFEVFACFRRLFDMAVSLSQGPEQRGMRREAVAAMGADKEAHARVYQLLMARTGKRVKEAEQLIASL